jgi:hypothetical protein
MITELSWFAGQVRRGDVEPFAEIVTVTPEIANRLLEQNECNRHINQNQINQIAHDIKNDQWGLNGETIVVSKGGYLNDGQHRLFGVIKADKFMRTFMVFGVERVTRMTVDMGRARSTGQFLGMDGVANYTECSATASNWLAYQMGYYGRLTKAQHLPITKQDSRRFYYAHQEQIDRAVSLMKAHTKKLSTYTTVLSTAYCILREINPVQTDIFFSHLAEGANLDQGDAVLWLRQRLTTGPKLTPIGKIELILRHWIIWRKHRPMKRGITLQGTWPEDLM